MICKFLEAIGDEMTKILTSANSTVEKKYSNSYEVMCTEKMYILSNLTFKIAYSLVRLSLLSLLWGRVFNASETLDDFMMVKILLGDRGRV